LWIKKIVRGVKGDKTMKPHPNPMPEGIQGDFPEDNIRQWGCHFLSLMKWCEVVHGEVFTIDRLLNIYNRAVEANLMQPNTLVLDSVALVNNVLGRQEYRGQMRDLKERPPVYAVLVRLTRPQGGTHFVMDIEGKIWDTLDPQRPAASTWQFDSYRVFV